MNDIQNKTKIILFASLIAALVLPFSGMNYAAAEMTDDRKQQLIDKLEKLQERIDDSTNESLKERLDARQQVILEKLFNEIDTSNLEAATIATTTTTEENGVSGSTQALTKIFDAYGTHSGCDGGVEVGNFVGYYSSGATQLTINQYFPAPLTSGDSPNCEEHAWGDNVYINIANVWDGTGCVGNMDVDAVENYQLNCAVLGGVYVLKVTADYDGEQLGIWSWFWA